MKKIEIDRSRLTVDKEGRKYLATLIMKMLDVLGTYVNAFRHGKLMRAECPYGFCYYLSDDEKQKVADFEAKHDYATVYALVSGVGVYGDGEKIPFKVYLYVTNQDVETALVNLDNNAPFFENILDEFDDPSFGYRAFGFVDGEFEESGSVGIIGRGGGIIRTA